MDVIIYHNPACGTSRNVLAMIRNSGVEPHIIEYLKCPPTRLLLTQLLDRAGLTVRQILREKGTPFHVLGLGDLSLSDDALLDAIQAHPILMNRDAEGRAPLSPVRSGSRFAAPATRTVHQGRRRARDRRRRPTRVTFSLAKRLAAECLGTGLLVTTVVGSGIMGERLSGGNVALALLGNTLPTGAILVVLILALGPISGAHFNPAVSLVMSLRKDHPWREFIPYAGAQIVGGCIGTLVAHGMFELPLFEVAVKARTGPAQWFAEFVATFGLIITILAVSRFKSEAIPVAVGLYITAAYWFTASTSFANPAVTIARALTNSFSGIAPADVPMFIVAQFAGALAGLGVMRWFFGGSEIPEGLASSEQA
jgi:arsenate reductase (glutaredoxin)